MKSFRHSSNNKVVRKPDGWDDRGGHLDLPAIDVTQGKLYGMDLFVTWWKPTHDELACLVRGGLVQLTCIGGMPPVNVSASDEDTQPSGIVLPH